MSGESQTNSPLQPAASAVRDRVPAFLEIIQYPF